MAFFLTKEGRRKSPAALVLFFTVLFYCVVYFASYSLLTEPLHRFFPIRDEMVESAVHTAMIALAGTGVCSFLFLLPDKRIVPCGFSASFVILLIFIITAAARPAGRRGIALQFVRLYITPPVIMGNLVSWTIYRLCFKGRCGKKEESEDVPGGGMT